jgi:cystathionine beta-lyase family protein involved in aluminum resistance
MIAQMIAQKVRMSSPAIPGNVGFCRYQAELSLWQGFILAIHIPNGTFHGATIDGAAELTDRIVLQAQAPLEGARANPERRRER